MYELSAAVLSRLSNGADVDVDDRIPVKCISLWTKFSIQQLQQQCYVPANKEHVGVNRIFDWLRGQTLKNQKMSANTENKYRHICSVRTVYCDVLAQISDAIVCGNSGLPVLLVNILSWNNFMLEWDLDALDIWFFGTCTGNRGNHWQTPTFLLLQKICFLLCGTDMNAARLSVSPSNVEVEAACDAPFNPTPASLGVLQFICVDSLMKVIGMMGELDKDDSVDGAVCPLLLIVGAASSKDKDTSVGAGWALTMLLHAVLQGKTIQNDNGTKQALMGDVLDLVLMGLDKTMDELRWDESRRKQAVGMLSGERFEKMGHTAADVMSLKARLSDPAK